MLPDPQAILGQLELLLDCQAHEPAQPPAVSSAGIDADFYRGLNSLAVSLECGHSPATFALADNLRCEAVARYNAIRTGPGGVTIPLKHTSSQSEQVAAWEHLCRLLGRAARGTRSRAAPLGLSNGIISRLSALKTDDAVSAEPESQSASKAGVIKSSAGSAPARNRKPARGDSESACIACLVKHPHWTNRQIGEHLLINPAGITRDRMPKFYSARDAEAGDPRDIPRGKKAKHGRNADSDQDVEAEFRDDGGCNTVTGDD